MRLLVEELCICQLLLLPLVTLSLQGPQHPTAGCGWLCCSRAQREPASGPGSGASPCCGKCLHVISPSALQAEFAGPPSIPQQAAPGFAVLMLNNGAERRPAPGPGTGESHLYRVEPALPGAVEQWRYAQSQSWFQLAMSASSSPSKGQCSTCELTALIAHCNRIAGARRQRRDRRAREHALLPHPGPCSRGGCVHPVRLAQGRLPGLGPQLPPSDWRRAGEPCAASVLVSPSLIGQRHVVRLARSPDLRERCCAACCPAACSPRARHWGLVRPVGAAHADTAACVQAMLPQFEAATKLLWHEVALHRKAESGVGLPCTACFHLLARGIRLPVVASCSGMPTASLQG